ncbi:Folic acid synthesis protein [Mycena venus]|uniref:2-amino-4-hydroxy-6-hydroxymethyldihydropteridine diphosphokinase n=1 Tax=Mycena venus TaxID=2733690 RepID=A0A8H6XI57_9AGAR|nr:Folic acid synthesis protein [Mycena venus]
MPQPLSARDTIRVNDLLLTVPLLTGAVWPKPLGQAALQPVLVSLSIPHDISSTASTDDLSHTINYSLLCSLLRDSLNDKTPPLETLEALAVRIFDVLFSRLGSDPVVGQAHLKVVQSRAPLNCKAVGVESVAASSSGSSWTADYVKHLCEDLECSTIIGVNTCEREERQNVRVNISIERWDSVVQRHNWVDFRFLTRTLHEKIGRSSYLTLEALASYIAEVTLRHLRVASSDLSQAIPFVTVKAAKPSAIVFASSSEIEIRRTYSDYPEAFARERKIEDYTVDITHTAALALGSNLGDRFYNIELALRLLEASRTVLGSDANVAVVNTSFLYESAPMYVTDQPSFINCACMIETNLTPSKLLEFLKAIETTVGRVPSIRNGPRAVDLDIILYDNTVIDTRQSPRKELDDLEGELVVPHPRLAEREFVLRPLNDMIPDAVHPLLHKTVSALLAALEVLSETAPMCKVVPFPICPLPVDYVFPHPSVDAVPPTLTYWTYPSASGQTRRKTRASSPWRTRVMATLNTTPDSFSDGAAHNTLPAALEYAQSAVDAGTGILDVGGYSTRPGAAFITPEEEISRVGPCIAAIRTAHPQLPISIDTFRPDVARAAISAGANCINDVYAFTGQESYPFPEALQTEDASRTCMSEMKKAAREFAVPVVLMHSRGDAGTNKDYDAYGYAGPSQTVLEGVRVELGAKVDLIVKGRGGVRRWFVIVDPGVGFSKTLDGNLEVLRDAAAITADVYVGSGNRQRNALAGYPQLIGASRKSFLGVILEQATGRKKEPKERGWATAAAGDGRTFPPDHLRNRSSHDGTRQIISFKSIHRTRTLLAESNVGHA